jgi:hypothetical protein
MIVAADVQNSIRDRLCTRAAVVLEFLGFVPGAHPEILPVNYALDGATRDVGRTP